jgi:hypothetical protein
MYGPHACQVMPPQNFDLLFVVGGSGSDGFPVKEFFIPAVQIKTVFWEKCVVCCGRCKTVFFYYIYS